MQGTSGDEIKAAISGKVIQVSEEGNLGKHIKIESEQYQTVYAHCSEIRVQEGDEIQQGNVIATIGSTGNSTGNHLHCEIRVNGGAQNPQN